MTLVKDPLLTAARVVLVFFIAVLSLAAAAVALAAPFVLIFRDRLLAEIASEGIKGAEAIYPSLPFLLLGIAVLLGLGVYFLVLLRKIVNSVGEGDPFVPVNATRLSRMGWTVLAGQLFAIPLGALVYWIASIVPDDSGHIKVQASDDFGFSGGGLLLMLVLFILARVFCEGTRMREELEGTV